MNIDNPAALHFIMQDDIFLLNRERNAYEERGFEEVEVAVAGAIGAEVKSEVVIEAAVVAATVQEPAVVYAKPVIKYKGHNTNGFVILVHYPATEFMHDAHLNALEATLKRKGFELNEAALINMAHHAHANFEQISADVKPQKLMLMGKSSLPSGMAGIDFNTLHSLNNCTALYTFSFEEMMDSNENKKAFWEQMKAL